MTLKITLSELLALKPCRPDSRAALFAGLESLDCATAFERGATVANVLWVAGQLDRKAEIVTFANGCAAAAKAAADAARAARADSAAYAAKAANLADSAADSAADAAARAANWAADAAARAAAYWATADAAATAEAEATARVAAEIDRQKAHLVELFA